MTGLLMAVEETFFLGQEGKTPRSQEKAKKKTVQWQALAASTVGTQFTNAVLGGKGC